MLSAAAGVKNMDFGHVAPAGPKDGLRSEEVTISFLFVPFGFLIVVTSPDLHGLARVEYKLKRGYVPYARL